MGRAGARADTRPAGGVAAARCGAPRARRARQRPRDRQRLVGPLQAWLEGPGARPHAEAGRTEVRLRDVPLEPLEARVNRDHWNSYLREYDPVALAAFYLGAELLGEPARRAAGLVNISLIHISEP